MKFSTIRETLLKPLQAVQGVVERRHSMPILGNLLMVARDGRLSVTATDLELELEAQMVPDEVEDGEITVPARKLIDITRALAPGARLELKVEEERAVLRCGRSRFTLSTLPAGDYPGNDALAEATRVQVPGRELGRLIELTQFAMAHQDVRYYLNGLLLEISPQGLRAVATDGHRLAVADLEVEGSTGVEEPRSIIIPRKAVGELQRVLATEGEAVEFAMGSNAIQVTLPDFRLTSKLIDGKFPDYERVIPRAEECDKRVLADREELRQGLSRAAILSNDKYRAVRLSLSPGLLRLVANNPEQEEAEDEVEVEYGGESVEIGFNVAYLIDALNALPGERACIHLMDAGSSALITPEVGAACRYVVMPMRL